MHFDMAWNFNTNVVARHLTCKHVNGVLCSGNTDVRHITRGARFEDDMTCLMIGAQEQGPEYYEESQNAGMHFTEQTVAGYKSAKDRLPPAPRPLAKRAVRHPANVATLELATSGVHPALARDAPGQCGQCGQKVRAAGLEVLLRPDPYVDPAKVHCVETVRQPVRQGSKTQGT
jgi:hypothetical protein